MTAIVLLAILGAGEELPVSSQPMVIRLRKSEQEEFNNYVREFEVTPQRAREIVEKFEMSLSEDEKQKPLGPLVGVVDDEYTFSYCNKTTFPLTGYRVNVHTGKVRFVSVEDVLKKYGERFLGGIPNGELKKYRPASIR